MIETTVDWTTEPSPGTFEVTTGSDALGCSAGSLLENGSPGGITNEFTCEAGALEGTFTIEWQVDDGMEGPGEVNGPWDVIDATGDFAGLTGKGLWSGTANDSTGYSRFAGVISFDP